MKDSAPNHLKAPARRFASFTDDWTEVPMGELMSFKNGYNAAKEQYGSGIKFINVLDIIENDFIVHDCIIGSVQIPEKDFEKNEVRYGDILFQRSSETREEVGQSNVYLDRERSATFGGFVIRGRPMKEFDPVFFNGMLKTAKPRKDMTSRSGGSTRYNIGQESLEAVNVHIPKLPEQRKIADFLTAVDGRIGQLVRKKALLEDYKKGVMQQLFTQALRFKDDHGNDFPEWEEIRFYEVLNEVLDYRGRTPVKLGMDWGGGNIKALSANNVKNGYIDTNAECYLASDALYDRWMGGVTLERGDIVFTMEAPLGKALQIPDDEKYILSQRVVAFKTKPFVDNCFLLQMIWSDAFQAQITKLSTGSTAKGINQKSFRTVVVQLPSLPEQTKIANFLTALDRKIATVSTQITETQTWKKGLLQQMFV